MKQTLTAFLALTLSICCTTNLWAEDPTVLVSYTDIQPGYAASGCSGSINKKVVTDDDLTIYYVGVNSQNDKGSSYAYNMYIKNQGFVYSGAAPSGYYPSKVIVTFSSGTGVSGKAGIDFSATQLSTRNSLVSGEITKGGTCEASNTNTQKTYWRFSTTGANVQVASIEVTYSSQTVLCTALSAPTNLTSSTTKNTATLSWSAVANATGYQLTFDSKTYEVSETEYTVENLSPSKTYSWSVAAKGDGDTYCALGTSSATQSATTQSYCDHLEAIYTVSSTSAVTPSGTVYTGSSAEYSSTYSKKSQLTADNSMTLTLKNYAGTTIYGLTLSMRSNASAGAGTFSMTIGDRTVAALATATNFNHWFDNTSYTTNYVPVHIDLDEPIEVQSGEDIVITMAATVSSIYCESFAMCYEKNTNPVIAMEEGDEEYIADICYLNRPYYNSDSRSLYFTTRNLDPNATLTASIRNDANQVFTATAVQSYYYGSYKYVTVTYTPTAVGEHTATLHLASVVSGIEETAVDIPLSGETLGKVTVKWMLNGEKYADDTEVWQGEEISSGSYYSSDSKFPDPPTWDNVNIYPALNKTFVGWSPTEVVNGECPPVIIKGSNTAMPVTKNETYHAVFADAQAHSGSSYWQKCTSLADIVSDGEYMITYQDGIKTYYLQTTSDAEPGHVSAIELTDITTVPRGDASWCVYSYLGTDAGAKCVQMRSIYSCYSGHLCYGGYLYTTNSNNGVGVKPYNTSKLTQSYWRITINNDGTFRMLRNYTGRDLVGYVGATPSFRSYLPEDTKQEHDLTLYRWIDGSATTYTNYVSNWNASTVTMASNDDEKGSAALYELSTTTPITASTILEGTSVTVAATVLGEANANEFVNWTLSDDNGGAVLVDANTASTQLTVGSTNVTVTANFREHVEKYNVSIQSSSSTMGTALFADESTEQELAPNDQRSIIATVADPTLYEFVNWTCDDPNASFEDATSLTTTFTAGTTASTITAHFQALPKLTVIWMNSGEQYELGTATKNQPVDALPTHAPVACDEDHAFMGWTASSTITDGSAPTDLFNTIDKAPVVTENNTTFYAVYARITTGTPSTAFQLVSEIPTLGDQVLIAGKSGDTYYALNLDKSASLLTIEDDIVVSDLTDLVWETAYGTKDAYQGAGFHIDDKYLHINQSAINITTGWTNGTLEIAADATAGYQIKSNQNSRWLSFSGSSFTSSTTAVGGIYFFHQTTLPPPIIYFDYSTSCLSTKLDTITLSGDYKTVYTIGDSYDRTNLVVTASYTNTASTLDVTDKAEFSTPDMFQVGTQTIWVTYTEGEDEQAITKYTSYDITINDVQEKTIPQFIQSGGGACYLVGTISGLSGTNFTLTDTKGNSIYIYKSTCRPNVGTIADGDRVKILASEYELYQGTKQEAKNVVVVHKYIPFSCSADVHLTSGVNIPVYTTPVCQNLLNIQWLRDEPLGTKIRFKYFQNGAEITGTDRIFIVCDTSKYNQVNSSIAINEDLVDISFAIKYQPKQANVLDTCTIRVEIINDNGTQVYRTADVEVYGRSLPEQFVLAIRKSDKKWYAIPNQLAATSNAAADDMPNAIEIMVDNDNAPTCVSVLCPNPYPVLYQSYSRYVSGEHRGAIRLQSVSNGKFITATTTDNTSFYMPEGNSNNQQFYLNSANFKTYKITLDPAEYPNDDSEKNYVPSRWISFYGDKIGWYATTTNEVYILPLEESYIRQLTSSQIGTLCLPFTVEDFSGAEFYQMSYKELDAHGNPFKVFYEEQVTTLEAGRPYIFVPAPEAEQIVCKRLYDANESFLTEPIYHNDGFVGTFTDIVDETTTNASNVLENNYMVYNNMFQKCGTGCWLNAYRAYIKMDEVPLKGQLSHQPVRRMIVLGRNGQPEYIDPQEGLTTDNRSIDANENNIQKFLFKGQLMIIRNEKIYNVQGQIMQP